MALLDIRQRAGHLFIAVILGHVILISAQIQSKGGAPVLEAVAFGAFAEVQRGASAGVSGVRHAWSGYVGPAEVKGRERRAQAAGRRCSRFRCRSSGRSRTRAAGSSSCSVCAGSIEPQHVAAEIIAASATPEFRTVTIDKGSLSGLRTDMAVIAPAGVVGRVVGVEPARGQGAAAHRSQRGRWRDLERSRAQGIVVGGGDDRLRMEYVSEVGGCRRGRRGDVLRHRRHLPEGLRDRARRSQSRKAATAYKEILVEAGGRFLEPRAGARRAVAGAGQRGRGQGRWSEGRGPGAQAVKVAWVVGMTALALALQTTLARFWSGDTVAVDLVLVVVVYAASESGPMTGLLTGTFAGLVQDALSSGVIGIGGLAKTIVGFRGRHDRDAVHHRAAVAPVRRIFRRHDRCTLWYLSGCTCSSTCGRSIRPYASVLGQAVGNAVVGVVAFQLGELLPGAVERRRTAKGRLQR